MSVALSYSSSSPEADQPAYAAAPPSDNPLYARFQYSAPSLPQSLLVSPLGAPAAFMAAMAPAAAHSAFRTPTSQELQAQADMLDDAACFSDILAEVYAQDCSSGEDDIPRYPLLDAAAYDTAPWWAALPQYPTQAAEGQAPALTSAVMLDMYLSSLAAPFFADQDSAASFGFAASFGPAAPLDLATLAAPPTGPIRHNQQQHHQRAAFGSELCSVLNMAQQLDGLSVTRSRSSSDVSSTALSASYHLDAPDAAHYCHWHGCGAAAFASAQLLTEHVSDMHVARRQGAYCCLWANCRRAAHVFRQRDKVMVHMRLHTNERRFRCPVEGCARMFSRADSYEEHQKVHSAAGRECVCPVPDCGRTYFHAKSLRKHQRAAHGQGV